MQMLHDSRHAFQPAGQQPASVTVETILQASSAMTIHQTLRKV